MQFGDFPSTDMVNKQPLEKPTSKLARQLYAGLCVLFVGLFAMLIGSHLQNVMFLGVGSSLAAGGIVSLILIFNEYLDEQRLLVSSNNLITTIEALGEAVAGLTQVRIVGHQAETRCVIASTPRAEFEQYVKILTRMRSKIRIDAMGLTLEKFHREQLERLGGHKEVAVRLIVQSPDSSFFRQLAKQEKRDAEQEAAESKAFTKYVISQHTRHSEDPDSHADMQIRWFEGCPSVTMLRINDVIYVRPRFLGADSEITVFYEKYSARYDGRVWEAYCQYFDSAWEVSQVPGPEMLKTT